MRAPKLAVFLAIVAVLATTSFTQTSAGNGTLAGPGPAASSSPTGLLHILAPVPGQRLAQSFVHVAFQIDNPGAVATTPNFIVRVDEQDPVQTKSTTVDFTGLAPGAHTVTVQLVDANNTPIAGATASVQFVTVAPTTRGSLGRNVGSLTADKRVVAASMAGWPGTAPLPLLSVIGFGVLVGGIVTAMRR